VKIELILYLFLIASILIRIITFIIIIVMIVSLVLINHFSLIY